jgi:hypothetical protein
MDSTIIIASTVGVGVGLAFIVPLLIARQRKKVAQLETLLGEREGMTLDEITQATRTGIFAKGYLMQALDALVAEGKLVKVPPPAGHPRLRIFRDTQYQLRR